MLVICNFRESLKFIFTQIFFSVYSMNETLSRMIYTFPSEILQKQFPNAPLPHKVKSIRKIVHIPALLFTCQPHVNILIIP